MVQFHSKFGGLWIDRSDWSEEVKRLEAAGRIDRRLGDDICDFVRDGYVVFEGAVPADRIDAFERKISAAFTGGSEQLLVQSPGDMRNRPVVAGMQRRGMRIVDAYARLPAALDLFSISRLTNFLHAIFGTDPLLFQSLSFDLGSEQGLHQDTAYVVVNRPLELAACWIALEDVQAGAGDLIYVPGSHRFPDFNFGGDRKHWDPDADGREPHTRWASWLWEQARSRNLEAKRFLAKKGDVLVWHADLAHGGSPITLQGATRKSLVGHFCPVTAEPNYFHYRPDRRTIRRHGDLSYASEHFDLSGARRFRFPWR